MKLTYKFKYKIKNESIDALCRASNDLYNQANYLIKQEFNKNKKWLRYNDLNEVMRVTKNLENEINYTKLKAQTSQQILRLLDKNWTSYFRSVKDFKIHPEKYRGLPKPPGFRKPKGKNLLIFTNQNSIVRDNQIILEKDLMIAIPEVDIDFNKFQQIRVLPKTDYYEIEIIYNKDCVNFNLDQNNYLVVDLGINNLASCISKDKSFILSGRAIKSVNHYYNKQKAKHQSFKDKKGKNICRKKLRNLSLHRSNFIKDQFHQMSRFLINYCIVKNIGTVIVGYNEHWKDSTDMGKISNQNFTSIPHKQFLNFLKYKCELVGIIFKSKNEAYTSKCDGLSLESVKKHTKYSGKRVCRGLFQSSIGKLINADINGALNILRKVIGDGLFVKDLINSVVLFNPVKIRFRDLIGKQTLSNLLVKC